MILYLGKTQECGSRHLLAFILTFTADAKFTKSLRQVSEEIRVCADSLSFD